MRLLGAARLSRDTDASTSVERQGESINGYAGAHGHTVVAITEDVDISGAIAPFDRPELGPWLTDPARIEKWDALVVAKLDRISRSTLDFAALIEWCKDNGKKLVCLDPNIDLSTPFGEAMAGVIMVFAQLERKMIGKRVAEGRAKLRTDARWPGGNVPYGYSVFKNGHMILVPNPVQKAVIERAAAEIIAGKSVNAIVRDFNSEGIASQSGAGWLASTLTRILRNPVIRGYVMHNGAVVRDDDGMPVRREALIDDDAWTQLQAALDANSRPHSGVASDANLLLRVAFCGLCGQPMYGRVKKGRGYGYYECATKRTGGKCASKSVRINSLDSLVTDTLISEAGSVPMREKIVIPAEDHARTLAMIEQQMTDIEASVINGMPISSATKMLAKLEGMAAALRAIPRKPERVVWVPTGQTFAEHWEGLSDADRHTFLLTSSISLKIGGIHADPVPMDRLSTDNMIRLNFDRTQVISLDLGSLARTAARWQPQHRHDSRE